MRSAGAGRARGLLRPELTAAGVVVAGVVMLGAAWARVAATEAVPLQVGAFMAGLIGLALVGLGLAVQTIESRRRRAAEERAVTASVLVALAEIGWDDAPRAGVRLGRPAP